MKKLFRRFWGELSQRDIDRLSKWLGGQNSIRGNILSIWLEGKEVIQLMRSVLKSSSFGAGVSE